MNATTGIGAAQKLITREQIAKPVALLMAPVNYGSEWREKEREREEPVLPLATPLLCRVIALFLFT